MNELALFAGAGGGILGGKLLGWRTVCAVEWEAYPASVLCARQNDGLLESFPIWDDVQTFDGKPWKGIVDVVSGGFPCQDISAAGKGKGIEGKRSSMWKHMARIIGEVRPKFVFVENSPMLTSRGLNVVLADLAQMGFDAEWGVLGASNVGGLHHRQRIWIVAKQRQFLSHSKYNRIRWWEQQSESIKEKIGNVADSGLSRFKTRNNKTFRPKQYILGKQPWRSSNEQGKTQYNWPSEPNMGRVVDGMAGRVDRLKAIGNGQVSRVAATAWELLNERL